jgi:hypothetical protein
MEHKIYLKWTFAFIIAVCSLTKNLSAQEGNPDVTTAILHNDSLFWIAYNNCETETCRQFFTEDVEFYHDKGGITFGIDNLILSIKNNLCSNEDFRLRREVISGTVKVFPLNNGKINYGAIISGEHVFYVFGKTKKERLDGYGKFTHVWINKNGSWKMSRILSYDHGPAPYQNTKKEVKLPDRILKSYNGSYEGLKSGKIEVHDEDGRLVLINKEAKFMLYPETETIFFVKDRDLIFEFIKNEKNKIFKMIIRENNEIADEATKINIP